MKLWLTSSEIADLALPGIPETDRGIRMLAEREDWTRFSALCRQRSGRGGGLEYHVNLLPVVARVAYFGAAAPAPTAGAALQAAPEPSPGTTSKAIQQLDARLAVLAAMEAFIRASEMKQTVAISCFVDLYNLGKIDVPGWVARILPRLAMRTVLSWLSDSRKGETQRLAVDRGASRRGQGVLDAAFDGEIKHFTLALHSFNDLYTARQLHEAIEGKFGARLAEVGLTLPGQRAFEIRFNAWKQEFSAGLLQMIDPDAFRNKMRVSGSYAYMAPHLNALWQIDASPVDALCEDGRHSIYVCIDVWSRRLILFVSKTPRSEAVQLLMRKAILAWGVPDAVKTDNGSDFVARATVRLFAKLQIEAIRSDPFAPWQKGYVERHIRTFQTDCARTLPGFVGHNVAQRKRIEGRKAFAARLGQDENDAFRVTLTGAELQAECDVWADQFYAMRPHSGIGKMTPFARAASSTRTIRAVDPDAIAMLLMQAPDKEGLRTVGKNGVRVGNFHYLAPGLVVGQSVFVRLDPHDAGVIWLFDPETDRLLARGVNSEREGIDRAALVAEVRALQQQDIDEKMAAVKASRKDIGERTVLDLRRQRAAEEAGNLVAFPPRSEIHTTPALDAGIEVAAIRRGDAPEPAPLSEAVAAMHRLIQSEPVAPAAENVAVLHPVETPGIRFRRALALEEALARGEPLETDDALWLGSYRASAEYLGRKAMFEDFGEAALR
ncbi:MAG: transposase [Bosea sp.]|uniref:Mu transposase C-terminal domain-containing protein n=1 Tax=Bosea sp. (in: a-proteobacteria) TaxID=1871050 RepID=UPI001AC8F4D2|nr:Mu transposase C-terminal domain-containing protein [Bosea sp. (in: a-proteobacteria)]MBN9471702.1 transposase [Bosea sp. (in: a-proteobacteria)]